MESGKWPSGSRETVNNDATMPRADAIFLSFQAPVHVLKSAIGSAIRDVARNQTFRFEDEWMSGVFSFFRHTLHHRPLFLYPSRNAHSVHPSFRGHDYAVVAHFGIVGKEL